MSLTRKKVILEKTADYTVQASDCGALITNRGAAGAVTITLPAQSAVSSGFWVDVQVVAGQTVTVATATVDTLVAGNDATADSIAWSTTSEKIGNGGTFIADGTGWIFRANPAIVTVTPLTQTIAT